MAPFGLLVEGRLDGAVGRQIVEYVGGEVHAVYGNRGFGYIEKKLSAFNRAAAGMPILALVDFMDTGEDCVVAARNKWLPSAHPQMIFRLVVREIESWLMADRAMIAQFLSVSKQKIPRHPEQVLDPKQTLINLARSSRNGTIRRLLVPPAGSTATEGPAYTDEMIRFIRSMWSVEKAARQAESLRRCILAVERLFENLKQD